MNELLPLLFSALIQVFSEGFCICIAFRNGRLGRKATTAVVLFLLLVFNIISIFISYNTWKPLLMYFLRFVIIFALYRESVKEKLFLYSMIYALTVPVEAISLTFLEPGYIHLCPLMEYNIILRIIASLLLALFQILWILLFVKLRREWEKRILNKFYIFMFGQFVLEICALLATYINHLTKDTPVMMYIREDTLWNYRLGIYLFILATVLTYFILFCYMKKEQINIQLRVRNEELEKSMMFYRKTEQRAAQIRRIRHDAVNHLKMAEYLIEKDPEKAKIYLDELKKSISKL